MKKKAVQTLIWITIFGISMAFLETAVVIYLRKLYYPDGFSFPIKMMGTDIIAIEFIREFATLVMLAGIGIIAGRTAIERFAYFILSFAVWDIFYYVFLKLTLNWPESFLTWDILFLIPLTWVGPVLAPVLNSITMIILAFCLIYYTEKNKESIMKKIDWTLLITGSIIVIFSYIQEFSGFLFDKFTLAQVLDGANSERILAYSCSYIPEYFNWWIFLCGMLLHLAAIFNIIRRNKSMVKTH